MPALFPVSGAKSQFAARRGIRAENLVFLRAIEPWFIGLGGRPCGKMMRDAFCEKTETLYEQSVYQMRRGIFIFCDVAGMPRSHRPIAPRGRRTGRREHVEELAKADSIWQRAHKSI
jgi:hypothetical protein